MLLDDDSTVEEILKGLEEDMDYTIREKTGEYPYMVLTHGSAVAVGHIDTISAFQSAGAKDLNLDTDDYQRLIAVINKGK